MEGRSAQLAVLAQDCDQADYTKLVQALCTEANVNLITVPSNKTLGEWCGLCKLDTEGLARKVVGCSFVVIKARLRAAPRRWWLGPGSTKIAESRRPRRTTVMRARPCPCCRTT